MHVSHVIEKVLLSPMSLSLRVIMELDLKSCGVGVRASSRFGQIRSTTTFSHNTIFFVATLTDYTKLQYYF